MFGAPSRGSSAHERTVPFRVTLPSLATMAIFALDVGGLVGGGGDVDIVLFALPVNFSIQIIVTQDLPKVEWWKWLIPFAAVVLIYFSRNTDDVLKHHVV